MSKNDDALRCAARLEDCAGEYATAGPAAAHLRRLVAENEAKDALLRQAVGALEFHQDQTRPIHRTQNTIAAIRQHLEGKA